jgi:menaquinone-dependent protoporphyrinogen IX oxidase
MLDWIVSKLSKSQDEMLTIAKEIEESNCEVEIIGIFGGLIKYKHYTFLISENNVVMRNNETGVETTAFFGLRKTIIDKLKGIIKKKR